MEKPDHKKLGQELDLFCFSDLVGSGLPLWTPKGTIIRNLLDDFVWELRKKYGYQQVDIPHLTKKDLYEKSGHWEKFKNELFQIKTREGHMLALKPMNCPHHIEIFRRRPVSWRELPQRYTSTTKMYRDEQTGELNGLARVRAITIDDAHVFCRREQIKKEFSTVWDIIDIFYKTIGFKLAVRLSFHDPKQKEKYLGTSEMWQFAENQLREIAQEKKVAAEEVLGEAAFYGPKIDFTAKDSLGREWQVATIQLDINMPERFDLTCTNEKGEKERLVMVHSAILGSIERSLAVLLEHFNGALPLWLAPVQVAVLPVSDKSNGYAQKVAGELVAENIRTEVYDRNETIGKKIREAETQKIPYLAVVGEKEEKNETVALRQRGKGDLGEIKTVDFIKKLQKEVLDKTIN
ncbi:MAG: threonine--tRNA ligase [Parcubacteria group bacterium]|nr:threonine--tRNA ligase [Parcubacteria group bacterium]